MQSPVTTRRRYRPRGGILTWTGSPSFLTACAARLLPAFQSGMLYLWSSTPLNLDDGHLLRITEDERVKHVSKVFIEHPGPFSSIGLMHSVNGCHCLLIKLRKDLILVNHPLPVNILLPSDILRCTSLRRLCLGFLRFPITSKATTVESPSES